MTVDGGLLFLGFLPDLNRWQGASLLFFGASIVFTMAGIALGGRRKR